MGSIISGLPLVELQGDSRVRISANLTFDAETVPLWFEVPAASAPAPANSDAFALAALLPAMRSGRELRIEGMVSPQLLANLDELQTIYAMWFPEFSRVAISAETSTEGAQAPLRALAFSGGVDSFHAALTSSRPIDRLIYVDRLDTLVEDEGLFEQIRASIRQSATRLGIPLYEVATNVRDFLTPYAEWLRHSHAIALATVAHTVTGTIGGFVIAGDHTYRDLRERADHPMLPPKFSSHRLAVEPFGWGTRRIDKVAAIVSSPIAMAHLRVCWRNEDAAFNCGRCEKCVRTKTDLAVNGALDQCLTLDDELDVEALRNVDFGLRRMILYGQAAVERARANRHDAIADALGEAVARGEANLAAFRVTTDLGAAVRSDLLVPAIGEHRDALYSLLSAHHGKWLVWRVMRDLPGKLFGKIRSVVTRSRRTSDS